MTIGVIILAAGASVRMGQAKLLLSWGGSTILGHFLTQWRTLGAAQVAVVCSEANLPMLVELDRLGLPATQRIFNPEPDRGMFSSIQCAARWTGWKHGLTHWVITLGDQPLVRDETLRRLLEFAAANPTKVCQPSRHDRPRHPVVLPGMIFSQLRDPAEEDLKQFLRNRPDTVAICPVDDPGLDLDLDEPSDYERALQLSANS